MIADLIERAEHANNEVLKALESAKDSQIIEYELACTSAMKALRRCKEADGLSPSARAEVKAAHDLCRRVLGVS